MSETAGFLIPIAAITMMLWLLWSESLRQRQMPRLWYFFRALLYVLIAGVMAWNGWRYGAVFTRWNWVFTAVAIVVAIVGAAYWVMRGRRG